MRITFLALLLTWFIACNSDKDTKVQSVATTDSTGSENTMLPQGVVPRKFVIGEASVTANMLELYKGWEDNNFELVKKHLADSMIVYGADGSVFGGSRDSAISMMQDYRNMYSSMKPQFHGFVTLKDQTENVTWFNMWYREYQTDLKGKTDSVELNENWKLNEDGKAFVVYQYIHHNPVVPNK